MVYNLTAELFAEWAIGIIVAGIRIYSRCFVDKRGLYWDDVFLILGLVFWTLMTITLYLCTDVYGSNIGLTPETARDIPDDEVPSYRIGSVCGFVAWIAYIVAVWAFKGVLVFLCNRLTMGLWQHRLSLIVGVLCICTFLVSLIFDLAMCRPIHKNWQVKPYAGDNCTLRPLNYIVIEVLSILTDLAVMCVPVPLVVAARIPATQKIMLVALFCSGIFVMICAILRAYYSVTDINTLATALGWASRECFVSVIIVCAPGIKPLFKRFRWFRTNTSSNGYSNTVSHGKVFSSKTGNFNTLVSTHDQTPYEMGPSAGWRKHKGKPSSGESQEEIISPSGAKQNGDADMGIRVTTDVHLELEKTQTGVSGRSHY
ncbi:uncharacterized protein BDW47DRAFT_135147 [Aspergillus candidus]|uniref:Rhodopsin domain-containing protein n=1 Tax=Aspergillus candidus TaxID=41067 RepID=A0A2I2FIC5_ASPCN|nr:hypothetical protein BDW47DRAFT_135147 [Aspergillus candidus]PLB40376.1 hypothetical protein BDW47DRAFT_135147 [Aspergillus candidus]